MLAKEMIERVLHGESPLKVVKSAVFHGGYPAMEYLFEYHKDPGGNSVAVSVDDNYVVVDIEDFVYTKKFRSPEEAEQYARSFGPIIDREDLDDAGFKGRMA